jgi:NAD(P)-dependent dehydrogenase (short-subunit alcohol dehydrogenase family)
MSLDGLLCATSRPLGPPGGRVYTSEGVESTFAAHLLFGTYLLGSLAMQALEETPGSRLVVVSSALALRTPFPTWEDATSTKFNVGDVGAGSGSGGTGAGAGTGTGAGKDSGGVDAAFDAQQKYAYAKRGQVTTPYLNPPYLYSI